jgi:D-sedoheptulose 7-phosphate isomerase
MDPQSMDDFKDYAGRLSNVLETADWAPLRQLAEDLRICWLTGKSVYLCGNGGSAGNAIHLANDYLYGITKQKGKGLKVTALTANSAVLTCLGNDIGYDQIFSHQIGVFAEPDDLVIVFSGSGNSPNILRALEATRAKRAKSFAILGYDGGQAKAMADVAIHFPVMDMQISEDMQVIAGHMLMQWLFKNNPFGSGAE